METTQSPSWGVDDFSNLLNTLGRVYTEVKTIDVNTSSPDSFQQGVNAVDQNGVPFSAQNNAGGISQNMLLIAGAFILLLVFVVVLMTVTR